MNILLKAVVVYPMLRLVMQIQREGGMGRILERVKFLSGPLKSGLKTPAENGTATAAMLSKGIS